MYKPQVVCSHQRSSAAIQAPLIHNTIRAGMLKMASWLCTCLVSIALGLFPTLTSTPFAVQCKLQLVDWAGRQNQRSCRVESDRTDLCGSSMKVLTSKKGCSEAGAVSRPPVLLSQNLRDCSLLLRLPALGLTSIVAMTDPSQLKATCATWGSRGVPYTPPCSSRSC